MTPFMLAVSGRAYPAAITVLEAAQKMAKGELTSWLRTGSLETFVLKCLNSRTCIALTSSHKANGAGMETFALILCYQPAAISEQFLGKQQTF